MAQMDSIDRVAGYDRRTSKNHTSYGAPPLRAQHNYEQHIYHSPDEARYGDSRHGSERGHHRSSDHQSRPSKTLLDNALRDLQCALETAADYLGNFVEDFDRDIQYIRPYAGSRIMEHLWVNKILSSNERSRKGDRSDSQQAESPDPRHLNPSYSFQSVGREVVDSFSVVKRSHASSRESSINPQNADRIRKKLEQASREIFKLMRTAVQRKADADALVTEMEMVLTFLDKTGPQRGHRETRVNERDQGLEEYARPLKEGSDRQGGFKDGREGFKEAQGNIPIT